MTAKSLVQNVLIVLLLGAPFVYAAAIWSQLPNTVPTHFDINGTPNGFSPKKNALYPIVFLMLMGLGVYFLMKNIDKIDPKRANQLPEGAFDKIGVLVLMLMSGVSIYIIRSMLQGMTGGFLCVLIGFFFAALGHLMSDIKPNYFVGLRLPWTLADDENWRKTHLLTGKLWLGGGLLIALASLFLTTQSAMFLLFGTIAVVVLIPVVYSYRLFKEKT